MSEAQDKVKTPFSPVFIVGHPRSGSTLLASVLGSHSKFATIPETHFLDITYSRSLYARFLELFSKDYRLTSILENKRLMDAGISSQEIEKGFKSLSNPSYKNLFKLFLELCISKQQKSKIIEKTPRHLEQAEKLVDWYPETKIICIIRDGRDSVDSLMNVNWTHSNMDRHAAYWGWCVRKAVFLRNLHPGKVLIVRYEDLLIDSEKTIEKIFSFLGEKPEQGLLNKKRSDKIIPKWESQWKEKSSKSLDKNHAYLWKKWNDANKIKRIESFIDKELKLLSYEVISPTSKMNVPLSKKVWSRNFFNVWYWLISTTRQYFIPRVGPTKKKLLERQNRT